MSHQGLDARRFVGGKFHAANPSEYDHYALAHDCLAYVLDGSHAFNGGARLHYSDGNRTHCILPPWH
jgi:hypothetical protein